MTTVVATVRTYPGSRRAWISSRTAALLAALRRRGVTFDAAVKAARAMLAHWWRETGAGRAEWNFAPGNVKASGSTVPAGTPGWHGEAMYLNSASDGRQLYRAFASIEDGAEDYLRLLEQHDAHGRPGRYVPALTYLLNTGDGRGFYARLLAEGYSPPSAAVAREYSDILRELGA